MNEQLIDIGRRLSALRLIQGFDAGDFARRMGISGEELAAYEKGESDFSFSFLYNAAGALGVDVMDLMSGDSPRLSACSMVRAGGGYAINRRETYSYKHLAFTFRNKSAEPFMVTVEPKADDTPPKQHTHDGQELNYMVSGRMRFYLGDVYYDLEPGDSVYFDSGIPHAMSVLDGAPATFLAVVIGNNKGGNDHAAI